MKEKNAVIGALRFTASALAEKRGLKLSIGGNTAYTNGKQIVLPNLPEDDQTARVLAAGYVDHESAHVKWTDFTIKNNPWQNILEDVRIERLQGERFPGAVINLENLVKMVVDRGGFAVPAANDHIGRLMLWAAARERRLILKQDALAERENLVEEECRKTLGNEFCDTFVGLVDQLRDCQTTKEVAKLAEEIRKLIKNPPEPLPPNSDDSEGAGSDGSGSEGAGSDGSGSDGSGGSGASSIGKALRDLANAEEPEIAPEMGQVIKKMLEEMTRTMDDSSNPSPLPIAEEEKCPEGPPPLWATDRVALMQQAVLKTGRMSSQLAGLLQSMRLKPAYLRLTGRKIAPRSVDRIAARTPARVFEARAERKAVNTAVTLLIDRSGSMLSKLSRAMAAAYAVVMALERIMGIKTIVAVFPGVQNGNNGIIPIKRENKKAHMTDFLKVMWAEGGTPITESLMWAGMKLTHMRGDVRRRIAILFTDGEPDNPVRAKDAVQKLKDHGIEVYAVILQDRYKYQVTWIDEKSYRVLDNIEDLPNILFGLLRHTLLMP